VNEGDFYHAKMHAKIAEIYDRRNNARRRAGIWDEGIYFGDLSDDIYESLEGGHPTLQDMKDAEEYLSLTTHTLSRLRELLEQKKQNQA